MGAACERTIRMTGFPPRTLILAAMLHAISTSVATAHPLSGDPSRVDPPPEVPAATGSARPADAAPADSPDGTALVAAALAAIGGDAWRSLASFESIATATSAMGDSRIEYRSVAPDARLLVQSMPGGRGVMTLGCAGGVAWMGEPGRFYAVDPAIARELAGGGDLQTLVGSLSQRFEGFRTLGRTEIDGRAAWMVAMTPRTGTTPSGAPPAWTLFVALDDARILGFDIPAPPTGDAAGAPSPGPQSIRLARWEPVELPRADAGATRPRLLAFREATLLAGGVRTDLVYERVAANHLATDAIVPPERLEQAPGTRGAR